MAKNVVLKDEENVQLLPQTTSELVTHGDSTVKVVLDGKQDILTAGTGINISGTIISCTVEGGGGDVDLSNYLTKSDAADTYATKSAVESAQSVADSAASAASAAQTKADEVADALASLQSALEALQTTVSELDDLYLKLTGGTLTGTLNVGSTKIETGDSGITLPNGIIIS